MRARALALTLGEPAGIGPDITIDAWTERRRLGLPPFLFVGDAALLRRRAALMGRDVAVRTCAPEEAESVFDAALPCLADGPDATGTPGALSPADAPAVIGSIARAVSLVREGACSAIVTNPIHKKALSGAGFPFPGHTEYLGALAKRHWGAAAEPVMMLASPVLRVVPVTIHMPLADVPRALTAGLIARTGRIVASDLARRFGIQAPRLAVSGLNPHAGEHGLLGGEDDAIVRPAVETLRSEGIDAFGPLSADTMFHSEARAGYDAALCMYHDQALIPLKTLAFDEGVNVTLGLPFVRTSPDHGTALDIAGTGRARATSLAAALKMAAEMAAREQAA